MFEAKWLSASAAGADPQHQRQMTSATHSLETDPVFMLVDERSSRTRETHKKKTARNLKNNLQPHNKDRREPASSEAEEQVMIVVLKLYYKYPMRDR